MKKLKKKTELQLLKKELDKWFSRYIRLRDCTNSFLPYGKCITCGAVRHWKKADAGHFIKRQYLATRWDEKNVNLQCKRCNAFEQGANEKYVIAIDKKWGEGTAEMLEIKKHNKVKMTKFEYEHLIKEYKQKVKELE